MLEGNDRTKVILAGAGIESLINDLLSKYFSHSEKLIDKSIKHTGFMGSFSSKAEMCYLLGLISTEEHAEIQKLIKLRNRFAHILEKRSLEIEKDHLNSYTLFKVHFKSDWNIQPCVFHLLFIFLTLKAYLEKAINNVSR
jgi:hypothetical protein